MLKYNKLLILLFLTPVFLYGGGFEFPVIPINLYGLDIHAYSAHFSSDGTKIITASMKSDRASVSNLVVVWDASSGAKLTTIAPTGESQGAPIISAVFSPNDNKVLTAFGGPAQVWDAATGALLFTLVHEIKPGYGVAKAAFSPDGTKIVTVTQPVAGWGLTHVVKIWNADSGAELFSLAGQSNAILSVAFSDDNTKIITTSTNQVNVWDARDKTSSGEPGALLVTLTTDRHFNSASFSPDGTKIVTIGKEATVWDAISRKSLLNLSGHTYDVRFVSFSPDGSKILTASADGTAKIWDATTGSQIFDLKAAGKGGVVSTASFNNDGTKILTTSTFAYDKNENVAIIWDVGNGTQLYKFVGPKDGGVRYANFSPDGNQVAIIFDEAYGSIGQLSVPVQIYQLPPEELLNTQTLKMTAYRELIKGFMSDNGSTEKSYGNYILYIHNKTPQKTIKEIWQKEKVIFDSLGRYTQNYLRNLISGIPF
jgi:WD40 repeat protein